MSATTALHEWRQHLAHLTDGRGKPIDPGILDTVAALNTLNIETTASCEGHLGWGCAGPWVDVQLPAPDQALILQYKKLEDRLDRLERRLQRGKSVDEAELASVQHTFTPLNSAIERPMLLATAQVVNLILDWYQQRGVVDVDAMLTVVDLNMHSGPGLRIQSQGVRLQDLRTREQQTERLGAYQSEMAEWTSALIHRLSISEPSTMTL
jgi:hypothetical protein